MFKINIILEKCLLFLPLKKKKEPNIILLMFNHEVTVECYRSHQQSFRIKKSTNKELRALP